jgi:hypothetical protein
MDIDEIVSGLDNVTFNEFKLIACIKSLQQQLEETRNQVRLELHTDIKEEICMTIREEMWQDFRKEIVMDMLKNIQWYY